MSLRKILSIVFIFCIFISCDRESMPLQRNDKEEFIKQTKKFSTNYGQMLEYVSKNYKNNKGNINSTIKKYHKINPFFDESLLSQLENRENNILKNKKAYHISFKLQQCLNKDSYEEIEKSLQEYIGVLENEEVLDYEEYFNTSIAMTLLDFFKKDEVIKRKEQYFLYALSDKNRGNKNSSRCAAIVIGTALGSAGGGCWMGAQSGVFTGPQGALAGCAVGAVVGAISGALSSWGMSDVCNS